MGYQDVQFNGEDETRPRKLYGHFESGTTPPRIIRWLLRTGIAKTQDQAIGALLGGMLLLLALSAYWFYSVNAEPDRTEPPHVILESPHGGIASY